MKSLMPSISECEVKDCAYNENRQCHAIAINVGSAGHCPQCDTFFQVSKKGGNRSVIGGVGACKQDDCKFNKQFECTASAVSVKLHGGHPDCATFQAI